MQSSEQFILFVLTFSLKTFHVGTNIVDKKIVVYILQCLLALTKIRLPIRIGVLADGMVHTVPYRCIMCQYDRVY